MVPIKSATYGETYFGLDGGVVCVGSSRGSSVKESVGGSVDEVESCSEDDCDCASISVRLVAEDSNEIGVEEGVDASVDEVEFCGEDDEASSDSSSL